MQTTDNRGLLAMWQQSRIQKKKPVVMENIVTLTDWLATAYR